MKRVLFVLCSVAIVFGFQAERAFALPEFKTEFKKKYIDKHKDEAFKKLASKQGCNICHQPKKKKALENLNEYGKHLAKLIEGRAKERKDKAKKEGGIEAAKAEKEKIIKELQKAFDEVAKMKSEAGDTFGDRIKNGLLPSSTDNPKDDSEKK